MKKCPECGGEMIMERVPKIRKALLVYETRWICISCDYWEYPEPDWDSMKGGKDHE